MGLYWDDSPPSTPPSTLADPPDSISSKVHSPSPSSKIWKSAAPENFTGCFLFLCEVFLVVGWRLESEKIATVKDADGTSEPTIFSEKWWLNNDNLPW